AAALVEVYNRGNLTNLILLTALRLALEGAAPPAPQPGPEVEPPEMLPPPPPLPRLDSLAPESAALVQGLAARHPGGVVPSLYLHLAHWPGLLAALPGWAGSLVEPTAVAAGRDAMLAPATAEAAALRLRMPAAPLGHAASDARAAIENFSRRVIPAMVPVGLGLRRLLAQP
ncbi:hypothetical protein QWZ14_10610, partial [Paeniroseomonas aquatica]